MAACTSLRSAALNPLIPIASNILQQRDAAKLSFAPPVTFSVSPILRSRLYSPPLCRHQLEAAGASEAPPNSREESLLQARSSISSFLEKALKSAGPSTVKQRKPQRQARLRVEMPLLDESDAMRASLLVDLFSTLSIGKKGTHFALSVFCNSGIMEKLKKEPCFNPKPSLQSSPDLQETLTPSYAKAPSFRCYDIADTVELDDTQVIVILAPKLSELTYMLNIAKAGDPRPLLLLNPDWAPEEEEAEASHASFLQSFEVVYSYLPLAIQGFFSKTEGAVLKHVKSGAPAGRPWLVFAKEGDTMKCVSSLKKRPTAVDLENALYNAMAANSPVTKSIKFLRGLAGKT